MVTVLPNFIQKFVAGYTAEAEHTEKIQLTGFNLLGINIFSEYSLEIFAILSVIGLIIYALSRDKTSDEFLLQLRMEAVYITFFITMLGILIALLTGFKSEMNALYVLELQVIVFLITKKLKKVRARPSTEVAHE